MKHLRRRNKAYRPKHVHVPVMPELQQEFAYSGHGALAALRLAPNPDAFEQLAAIFNVVYLGLAAKGDKSLILESGMRAMQDISVRADRTGTVGLARHELPPIRNAVLECEKLIRALDIVTLHNARVKSLALAQQSRAQNRQGASA
ncbi:hypothetical protein D3870_09820 [Noviherbaspirillum cavernae]|uniref:Uncharacterized protein n=1 Tax=Noviherbaspirillum cavernae TaxID=2320862 RepID=A0A418X1E5_9BURK|nr:hypothetical protein [Noviherbaspirillum cavernae]RJG06270.1 hypothetical protein D3870_09820 [Noviherbaspirillum cavernae]